MRDPFKFIEIYNRVAPTRKITPQEAKDYAIECGYSDAKEVRSDLRRMGYCISQKQYINVKYKGKKIVTKDCLKCHKPFTSEVDKRGIPYNRICDACHVENKLFNEGLLRL